MAINWILPVRGLQAVLSCAVLGLMSYVASWWSTHWRQFSPHEVNFLIFSPVWSLLALAALVVLPWKAPSLASQKRARIGLLALDALTMLYWFAGFVALAVFLADRICFGTVCAIAKASVAVSAMSWVAWTATTVVGAVRLFRGGFGGGSGSGTAEAKVEMHQGV
ncbi:uncharacterized protein EI97DRAFT_460348 [Westerdykella ornata]|uniref:MARVEL domain-containing protein n=1 Tax=Westerdykella ornata TaxID=318751 RepID=A0A6A6JCR7_WESOR|nr:uncharacterized protein EI97DRAFT_460348 [Westerdykella ornata]KAF2274222.1 hypothetical protein EI97DRAFT_460348 [Westerdykella ornata]